MLSSDVRVGIPTREAYSRSCNWSIDISPLVLSQFDAFLPISISGYEHRPDTSFRPGSSAPLRAIHGRPRISIGRDVTNSHKRPIDSNHLSWPRFAAEDAKSKERRERSVGTSALSQPEGAQRSIRDPPSCASA